MSDDSFERGDRVWSILDPLLSGTISSRYDNHGRYIVTECDPKAVMRVGEDLNAPFSGSSIALHKKYLRKLQP